MRDHVLVDGQAQVDQIASAMSRALSDPTTAGAVAANGCADGSMSISARFKSGNTINLTYTSQPAARSTRSHLTSISLYHNSFQHISFIG